MRIVLSGGGTGGHIYPALALREHILKKYPEAEFLYIGTDKGLEHGIVTQLNIPFESIKIQGIKRSLSLDNLKTAWYVLKSVQHAKKILKQFKPDIVIGTGGYVCGPVLYAATKLGVFTMIHEQNSVAGITNKVLAKYVSKICICFDDVKQNFRQHSQKVVLTGNPRGQQLVESKYDEQALQDLGLDKHKQTVLIFGGSRGAANLNKHFIRYYEQLAKQPYQVLMVTGQVHYEQVMQQIKRSVPTIKVVPYLSNMTDILHLVDLVVCRSGATTLAELTALGVPSILVPSPYVTNNHQEKNALSLVEKHAAEMVLESELDSDKLYQLIQSIMLDESLRQAMATNAKALGIKDASSRLLTIIEKNI